MKHVLLICALGWLGVSCTSDDSSFSAADDVVEDSNRSESTSSSSRSEDDPPVIFVGEESEAMNRAMQQARDTFHFFEDKWQDGGINYSLKFGLPNSHNELEHIWFNPTAISNGVIEAVCANNPKDIPGLKLGDKRRFQLEQLSDWMILAGKKCYGGYTIRVLKDMGEPIDFDFEFADY